MMAHCPGWVQTFQSKVVGLNYEMIKNGEKNIKEQQNDCKVTKE